MEHDCLIETHDTERIKMLSVWRMFGDVGLSKCADPLERRDRKPFMRRSMPILRD
jgi:hypothetical protein